MNKIFILLLAISLSACASHYPREYPKLVEKNFSPNKSGVIEHQKPRDGYEQKQYQLASVDMMKKFCKGQFKVLSEKEVGEVVGSTTSGGQSGNMWSSATENEKEFRTRISFECIESKAE